MDAANIRTVVHVTAGFGEQLRQTMKTLSAYPGRFIVCTTTDWRSMNAPVFTHKRSGTVCNGSPC
jgi:peptidoglycan/xylan/chitin deacetylase (PgdA/CDA1 family)